MATYTDINKLNKDVYDIDAINQSIRNILLTRRGSVPGKPRFGSDLYKLIFTQLDHITEDIAKKYILQALSEFENRIQISKIEIGEIPEYHRLTATIYYRYKVDRFNEEYSTSINLSYS